MCHVRHSSQSLNPLFHQKLVLIVQRPRGWEERDLDAANRLHEEMVFGLAGGVGVGAVPLGISGAQIVLNLLA
eukprot:3277682-Pyramimonas_sp.AAC.1